MSQDDQVITDASDESEAAGAAGAQDPIKNIKGEMGRKFENIQSQLQEQNKVMEQLLNQLAQKQQQNTRPNEQTEQVKLSDLVYNDPDKAAAIMEQRAYDRATQAVNAAMNQKEQAQAVLAKMTSDYPELNDESSELRSKALSTYASLSDSDKANPNGYRIAIREAAAELGILPSAKRPKKESNDNFSLGSQQGGKREGRNQAIDSNTLALAEAMGLNVKDPKVLESLKKRSQRTSWGRYE